MVESCLGPGNEARPNLFHCTYCKQLKLEWRPGNEAISKFYSLAVASLSSLFPSLAPRVWEAGDMGGWDVGGWDVGGWDPYHVFLNNDLVGGVGGDTLLSV